ncbi:MULTISPECIES: hypothetical protein [Kitasatospora]|uniref:Uncharacterized protein n=1 Tax=Kitasatospora cineracea TaxID=88074 RepID=A0A3N4RUK1_9ACTN|nr:MULTISPECIES: hypothetical protein [Kitasatospora]ROR46845.1 hypothetical protein EDD39_5136 [Kitasatospora cineracea]RPE37008.1 hypothetical protein EDD38_5390 [Kitasatospora cineracea]
MAEHQVCPGCGGARGTEKTEHSVETDPQGGQRPVQRTYWSPCSVCGGSGVVQR